MQNLDSVSFLPAAVERGDVKTLLGLMDDAIVWDEPGLTPYGDRRVSRNAVAATFQEVSTQLRDFIDRPEELVDGGGIVVSSGRNRGIGRSTGLRLDEPFINVRRIGGGKVVGFRTSHDSQRWPQAIGAV